jgi:hypothetical protein
MPLRSLVALCRLGPVVSNDEGSGVADCCSDLSNAWSFLSATEGDVLGGVGLAFLVGKKGFSDGGRAASDSGDEVGVLS